MKKQIFTLAFALCAAFGYSQSSNSATWPATGPVGLGTTSPSYKLHVASNSTAFSFAAYTDNLANFGRYSTNGLRFQAIGYEIPGNFGSISISNAFRLQMTTAANAFAGFIEYSNPATLNTTKAAISFGYNGSEFMRINENGKVRIASTDIKTPDGYKLFVEQGILTEKVKVALKDFGDWADYVFAPDYKLMTLEEVEKFTKENNHLPNVPSAAEMINNGLDVAKMDAKLMEKVEELTLYIIEQNKINAEQTAKIETLTKLNEKQTNEIEDLKNMVNALLTKK